MNRREIYGTGAALIVVIVLAMTGPYVEGRWLRQPTADHTAQSPPINKGAKASDRGSSYPGRETGDTEDRSAVIISSPTTVLQPTSDHQPDGGYSENEKGWWNKLATDPNATFSGAVAVFTLALVIVGYVQARRLRETVKATIVGAKAAVRAADAAEQTLMKLERPHLFLLIKETNFVEFIARAAFYESATPTMRPMVIYCFRNYGKTPAILRSMRIEFAHWSDMPEPVPIPNHDLPLERVIAPDRATEDFVIECMQPIGRDAVRSLRTPGGSYLWFHGKIEYGGIFDDTVYETEFLWKWSGAAGHFGPEYSSDRNRNT